jgi:septal ring-binding cell division protein DamX
VAHTQDEGFHEIQLNGKQLVFLFMAVTVVSVVIFLCGVLVGRGVRAERGTVAENTGITSVAETTPQPLPPTPAAAPAPAGSDPRTAAPPPAVDDLSYFNRLEKEKAPQEQLKAAVEKREPRAAPPPPPPPKEPVRTASADASSAEPPGQGYAVQIAALNVRDEADAIAKRLSSKGYAAYVIAPATGSPVIYRVRIGKFTSRREAESMAAKLKKEEQLNPWVTR